MSDGRLEFLNLVPKLLTSPEHDQRIESERREAEEHNRAKLRASLYSTLLGWGVPKRHARLVTQDSLRESRALEVVRQEALFVVLAGGVGNGKTTAAAWWIAQGEPPPIQPVFASAFELQQVDRFSPDRTNAIVMAGRLVIDDLGVEYADEKGAFQTLFDYVINKRWANELPLVITTNLTAPEFCRRYGERNIDRLQDLGGVFVELSQPTLRGKDQET